MERAEQDQPRERQELAEPNAKPVCVNADEPEKREEREEREQREREEREREERARESKEQDQREWLTKQHEELLASEAKTQSELEALIKPLAQECQHFARRCARVRVKISAIRTRCLSGWCMPGNFILSSKILCISAAKRCSLPGSPGNAAEYDMICAVTTRRASSRTWA